MSNNSELSALTPHEAAGQVGVGVQSIRRWCEWHSIHLSSGASPGPGIPRRLNARDIEVLRQVKDLRYQGLQTEAINDRLADLTFPEIDTEAITTLDSEELAPVAAQEGLQQAQGIIVTLEAMQRQLDGLQAERANRRAGWERDALIFVIGLGVGVLLLVGVLAAMALWGSG